MSTASVKKNVGISNNQAHSTVPPILLASIALQESTCNPDTVGGAGEQGLMQLTSDKCNEAPGGNCKDLVRSHCFHGIHTYTHSLDGLSQDYNIRTGAKFFSDTVASQGGNALEAIGMYNGWTRGMTYVCNAYPSYTSKYRRPCKETWLVHQFFVPITVAGTDFSGFDRRMTYSRTPLSLQSSPRCES